ncbi:MAG TPA: DUF4386 domain-containing protein [Puia sp.]|nr:DUF4386 domain-containing protein [Puia sp.]
MKSLQEPITKITTGRFALIAGIAMVFMGTTPYAEFFVYHKLVVSGSAEVTVKNILANKNLFITGIFGYLINFIADVVAAWAFYGLLKPVNEMLSLLTAWLRLVYTVISLAALLNLLTVLRLVNSAEYLTIFDADQLHYQVMFSLHAFRDGWTFAYYFFGIHLILLGYLIFKSSYIPRIIGVLLIADGLGWIINTIQPVIFPHINLDFIAITFFGELVLLFWLLIKGPKIRV